MHSYSVLKHIVPLLAVGNLLLGTKSRTTLLARGPADAALGKAPVIPALLPLGIPIRTA